MPAVPQNPPCELTTLNDITISSVIKTMDPQLAPSGQKLAELSSEAIELQMPAARAEAARKLSGFYAEYKGRTELNACTVGAPTTLEKVETWKLKPTNQGYLGTKKNRVRIPDEKQKRTIHPMTNTPSLTLLAILQLVPLAVFHAAAADTIPIPAAVSYTTSWLGNTYGIPGDHIMQDITDLAVTPDGKVVAATRWDEGGTNIAVFQNGTMLGRGLESGTGDWGRESNAIVATGSEHFYFSLVQNGPQGGVPEGQAQQEIKRYSYDGRPSGFPGGIQYDKSCLEMVTSADCKDKPVVGLVVIKDELFAADTYSGTIKVYQLPLNGQEVKRSFPVPRLGRLDADQDGFLWMLQAKDASDPAKLVRYSAAGVLQPQQIVIPENVAASDFCVDHFRNRILLTNAGVDQNILIFSDIASKPKAAGTFGITGGINAGTAGVVGPLRFNQPTGVGVDKKGNIYVACRGTGLEAYSPSGARLWEVQSLLFVDCVDHVPGSDSVVYGNAERFEMDYAKTQPGSEWVYKACTLNRFKYPQDPRLATSIGTVFTRLIEGKTFLYMTGMYGEAPAVYRFNPATDGETAIPCVLFGPAESDKAFPPNRPTRGEWLWTDNNGDGRFDKGEFAQPAKPASNTGTWTWHVDDKGTVWTVNGVTKRIRSFPCMGLDGNGTPIYRFDQIEEVDIPAALSSVNMILYDQPTDVMYLTGYSQKYPSMDGYAGGVVGHALVRINDWSTGNRTPAWEAEVPMDISKDLFCKSICMAGDYIFAVECRRNNQVYVFSKDTGKIVAELEPGPEVGSKQGWVDIPYGISAYQRSTGEYLVFVEDDGFLKNVMYRMKDGLPGKTALPSFSPRPGTYDGSTKVTITSLGSGATTRYTTDGSEPTATTGSVYGAPLDISDKTILKAITVPKMAGRPISGIASGFYGINTTAASPVFAAPPNTYSEALEIGLSSATAGATIRYTTNGAPPTATTGMLYTGPVKVSATTKIQAVSIRKGLKTSPVASGTYVVSDAVVSLSPSGGDLSLTDGDANEPLNRSSLPGTYTLNFDHPVSVERLVLSMPSSWGGPVDMTAEIRGGMDAASAVRLIAPKAYPIAGNTPSQIAMPATRLMCLQIVISATHNGQGNLSEVEIFGHNLPPHTTPNKPGAELPAGNK